MSEERPSGEVKNQGVLDLTWARTPEDLSAITSIKNVGVVLVPASLAAAVGRIVTKNVGVTVPVPEGVRPVIHVGQVQLRGEALAAGSEDSILIAVGQVIITTPITSVGYRGVHVIGQVIAPVGSEEALGPKLAQMVGQSVYYPVGARIVLSKEKWSRQFLELLPEPVPYCILGEVTIEDDVTADLLQSKVTGIALVGSISAPASLVPLLQVLAPDRLGEIHARE